MIARHQPTPTTTTRPSILRWLFIAGATLILCSCRTATPTHNSDSLVQPTKLPPAPVVAAATIQTAASTPTIAQVAAIEPVATSPVATPAEQASAQNEPPRFTSRIADNGPVVTTAPIRRHRGCIHGRVMGHCPACLAGQVGSVPPYIVHDSYQCPPNFPPIRHKDEYLCDGGDGFPSVAVHKDFSVIGLEMEDTIVHFDTIDGKRTVVPSNPVCIYAPRFAAVRKVTNPVLSEGALPSLDLKDRMKLASNDENLPTGFLNQPRQLVQQLGRENTSIYRDRNRGVGLENVQHLRAYVGGVAAWTDFEVVRTGTFKEEDKPRLAQAAAAAITWTDLQAVQILIKETPASVLSETTSGQSVYRYEMPPGKPKMRVIKLASKKEAQGGEIVEFTLRYDNIGNEQVGNVTLIDNLTTRLEYVKDSAKSSLEADFFTVENEGDSLILRWEIIEPIDPGKGGVITFKCRVR